MVTEQTSPKKKSKMQIRRGYLEVLARREDYLREKLADPTAKGLHYADHEANALKWAIDVCSSFLEMQETREMKNEVGGQDDEL